MLKETVGIAIRAALRTAMDFVLQEVMSDIARIDSAYAYSLRTVSVLHHTTVRYHILVTARTAGDYVLLTLERADTGRSVSGMVNASGFSYYDDLLYVYDTLIDDLLG